jgi:SSS family solute:Na+ symporter/sodium/proline symporter
MTVKSLVIALYALMIVGVGVAGLRRTRSFHDFFLGGGNVGPWMTAFTYATAYFSAVLFVGFAGKIGWGFGLSGLWIALCNAGVGVLLVWGVLGHRVKRMSVDYGVATMAEFFEKRYGSRFLKLFASVAVFVFFIPYSSAVFMGLSYLFTANFGLDYTLALALMGGFTAIYLALGGYKSMTMIDVVFGMIMLAGVSILLGFTLDAGGGLERITADLAAIDPALAGPVGPPGWWPLFCLVFLTSVAPLGMPQLVQKFYAIKDRRAIRIGMVASTGFALLIGGVAYFTGATTRLFLTPETTPAAFADGRPVHDVLMPELLARVVPESLSVLMLLLILSASMSTLAALVLISSSAVVKDLYAGFVNRGAGDARLTGLMRAASVVFVALSVVLAYFRPATIVAILGVSWGAIGSVFLGPFIWGLFTRRVGRGAAVASSVLGLAVCVGLYAAGRPSPEAGTLGMMTSLGVAPVVGLVAPGIGRNG